MYTVITVRPHEPITHTHRDTMYVSLVLVHCTIEKLLSCLKKKTAGLSLSCTVCYDVNIWGILSRGHNDWQKNSN